MYVETTPSLTREKINLSYKQPDSDYDLRSMAII